MSRDRQPHAQDAEIALIGALMLNPTLVDEAARIVSPAEFFNLRAQRVYQTILELYREAVPIDIVTVSDALTGEEDASFLLEAQNATPSLSRVPTYASMIREAAVKRQGLLVISDMTRAYSDGASLQDLREIATELVGKFSAESTQDVQIHSMADVMEGEAEAPPEWLVPHIVQRGTRTVVLGTEGTGKSTLLRQIGAHAAAGRDPFNPMRRTRQIKVLYVDAENPMRTIRRQMHLANRGVDLTEMGRGFFDLWHCPDGADLRSPRGRAQFESVIQRSRPDLILAGPLYKLFRRSHSEDLEQATIDFCEMIDKLRVRYDFAFMVEHHVPKGDGKERPMTPFGSSVLMRWPDIGIALNDHGEAINRPDKLTVDVERYRGDREPVEWPETLTRGEFSSTIAWSPRFAARQGSTVGAQWIDDAWTYEAI